MDNVYIVSVASVGCHVLVRIYFPCADRVLTDVR